MNRHRLLRAIGLTPALCFFFSVLAGAGDDFLKTADKPLKDAQAQVAKALGDKRLAAPCRFKCTSPDDFTGRKETLISTRILHYPLKQVIESVFHEALYSTFQQPGADVINTFELEVEVYNSELKVSGGKADIRLILKCTLREPGGKSLLTSQPDKRCKESYDSDGTVPSAIYKAVAEAGIELMKSAREDPRVVQTVQARAGATAPSSPQIITPPAPLENPGAVFASIDPRRPENAGALSEATRLNLMKNNRWRALLIGISDYSQTGGFAESLKGIPANDVKCLKDTLTDKYCFSEVVELTDGKATRRGILAALKDLYKTCAENDNVLIYYAGHGHLPVDNVGIWIPCDARSEEDGISNSEIKDKLANLPARRVLLVSDSCFSGSFLTRALAVKPASQSIADTATSIRISESLAANHRASREAISSGNMAPVPNAGSGPYSKNSPFAASLLNALESAPKGAALSTTDLYVESYTNMQKIYDGGADRPRPQRGALPGHAGGEFFLVRVK